MTSSTTEDLVEVHLIGVPLEERQRAAQHFDELMREFALMAGDATAGTVPSRLLELRNALLARFSSFLAGAGAEMDAALARGATSIDVHYRVPASIGTAAAQLDALLDEADEYCRSGDHLLTLAAPERAVRFRRWYLGEFVRQVAGQPPEPWTPDS